MRRNRHFLKPKEQSVSNSAEKKPTEVTQEQPVAAASDRKENSASLPNPATSTFSAPVSDIPPDPVTATQIKRTHTGVVKPPKRFNDFVS